MDTLEHCLARLERTNRRYRWCMIGFAALLLLDELVIRED